MLPRTDNVSISRHPTWSGTIDLIMITYSIRSWNQIVVKSLPVSYRLGLSHYKTNGLVVILDRILCKYQLDARSNGDVHFKGEEVVLSRDVFGRVECQDAWVFLEQRNF